jgi:glycosyltransferase involved in cell wall biosynthesis
LRDADGRVELLENEVNQGFVQSVNRGMRHDARRDVVLLNNDSEVASDWLDRLQTAAYGGPDIGTVTPFSNNATICSYPCFCKDNPMPRGMRTADLDRIFADVNRERVVEVPTAVGFCMYIRRDCLDAVGLFDAENFRRGYGEENDFCMRAFNAGWRSVLALDTFVMHSGGVSFGAERSRLVQAAGRTIRQLHPQYDALVQAHIEADPARTARLAVDLQRLRLSGLPGVLFVSDFGGGAERHVRELVAVLDGQVNVFLLRSNRNGETLIEWARPGEGFCLAFRPGAQCDDLATAVRALNVVHVHYHHLAGHAPCLFDLPAKIGVTHDFTVHDYFVACPQIFMVDKYGRYCGEEGDEQCAQCLKITPAPGAVSIRAWRDRFRPLIDSARFVFAPSIDAAYRMRRYFPGANYLVVPHEEPSVVPAAPVAPVPTERALRIVVLGALSAIKGADVLEMAAVEAARRNVPLEFHLLGYAYRPLQQASKASLIAHGKYQNEDLPRLIQELKPDLVWFPALWPETYSDTLSASLDAGLPVVAVDLGAFVERLHQRAWSWICPWYWSAVQWIDFFEQIRQNFLSGTPPVQAQGGAGPDCTFRYDRDYLPTAASPRSATTLTEDFLNRHRPGRVAA